MGFLSLLNPTSTRVSPNSFVTTRVKNARRTMLPLQNLMRQPIQFNLPQTMLQLLDKVIQFLDSRFDVIPITNKINKDLASFLDFSRGGPVDRDIGMGRGELLEVGYPVEVSVDGLRHGSFARDLVGLDVLSGRFLQVRVCQ